MEFSIKVCVVLYTIAMVQSVLFMIYLLVKGRKTNTLYSLIACQVLVFLWLLFGLFEETYRTLGELWLYTKLALLPLCFIGSAWFVFCMYYCQRQLLGKMYVKIFLFGIPSLLYVCVLTTERLQLFIRSLEIGKPNGWGVLFFVSTAQIYVCFTAGIVMLAVYLLKQHQNMKKQFILLMISIGIPMTVNILTGFGIIPALGFDLTPAMFPFIFAFIAVGISKYKFFDRIIPFALKEIVQSMKESVVVVDNYNQIIDFNKSFHDSFNHCIHISRKDNILTFVEKLGAFSNHAKGIKKMSEFIHEGSSGYFEDEISVAAPEFKSYSVYIKSIADKKNEILGKIISFNDITNHKKMVSELNGKNDEITAMNEELTAMNEELTAMNDELSALNEQLKDYSKTVEELTVERERNRFSKDAHDTLGHTMAVLIALLEIAKADCGKESGHVKDQLSQAIDISKDGLNELRRTISGLAPQNLKRESLVNSIKSLISNFTASGMNVDFTVQGVDKSLDTLHSDTIYRLCQEALTNSLRHGNAKNATIILQFYDNRIRLCIFDDGRGCKKIKKGFGLTGMEERLERLGGNIICGSDGEIGFNINVEIPLGVKSNV